MFSTPAVGDSFVCFATAKGGLIRLGISHGDDDWKKDTGNSIFSSLVLERGKLLFGCTDGRVHCYHASTGEREWVSKDHGGPVYATPLVLERDDGQLIVASVPTSGKCMEFSNFETGEGLLAIQLPGSEPVFSTPVVDSKNDTIVLARRDDTLYGLKVISA